MDVEKTLTKKKKNMIRMDNDESVSISRGEWAPSIESSQWGKMKREQ